MPIPEPTKYPVGQTALIAKIPEAEPLVSHWRSQYDPAAADGIPPHVTILYPFLPHAHLNKHTTTQLSALLGTFRPINTKFQECRRFPNVLYLAPTPAHPFQALTQAITKQWPQAKPYAGQF